MTNTNPEQIIYLERAIGQTLSVTLEQVKGEFSAIQDVSANLLPVESDGTPDKTATPILFGMEQFPDAKKFVFTVSHVITAGLTPGRYVADIRIELTNTVLYTRKIFFELNESVT